MVQFVVCWAKVNCEVIGMADQSIEVMVFGLDAPAQTGG
jgi:hypothetical protein